MTINASQRILLNSYQGGEYAHVTTIEEAREVGDTLFVFLFLELSDGEDCEDLDTAHQRVSTAINDLYQVQLALYAASLK